MGGEIRLKEKLPGAKIETTGVESLPQTLIF